MTFWRAEFAPRTPGDKFEKQYAYNIRHNYGKEGNRKSYTPYSCLKVISATPGVVSCIHLRLILLWHSAYVVWVAAADVGAVAFISSCAVPCR